TLNTTGNDHAASADTLILRRFTLRNGGGVKVVIGLLPNGINHQYHGNRRPCKRKHNPHQFFATNCVHTTTSLMSRCSTNYSSAQQKILKKCLLDVLDYKPVQLYFTKIYMVAYFAQINKPPNNRCSHIFNSNTLLYDRLKI